MVGSCRPRPRRPVEARGPEEASLELPIHLPLSALSLRRRGVFVSPVRIWLSSASG